MPAYKIENSDLSDLDKIVKLNYSIFHGMYESKPYSLDVYQSKLVDKKPIIFITTEGNKIIGDSIAYEKDGGLYLWILGVSKEHRNLGVGKQLLEKNQKCANENNLSSVTVKVYGVSVEMLNLLKNNGYKIVKIEKSQKSEKNDIYYFALQI